MDLRTKNDIKPLRAYDIYNVKSIGRMHFEHLIDGSWVHKRGGQKVCKDYAEEEIKELDMKGKEFS